MHLKPRIATKVAMIIGGVLFSVIGLPIGFELGGFLGVTPIAFGVLGMLWIVISIWALTRRNQMTIRIDETGIELPAADREERILLQRDEIEMISKHESLKGRKIQILLKEGRQIFLPIREYCELKDFITYCRKFGLPVK